MRIGLLIFFINIFITVASLCQTPTILRGTVTDEGNGLPLAGASVLLNSPDSIETIGTTTDSLGRYRLEGVPIGRQQLQVSYLGFETVIISELLIETGKEFIQNIQLTERPEALGEVVVIATGENSIPHPLSIYTLKVEEQFRYPTTYFDPARLAMSLPGVAGVDDQGNSISVRGNSPAALRWRLEGVDIVNPNHTANAGTFSDRPTAAGGGVNILSAQLLGTSNFLTGAYPAGYGNALGGIMDMHFRDGNDERHEFTAQVGVIGVEAAAEGPLGSRQFGAQRKSRSPGIGASVRSSQSIIDQNKDAIVNLINSSSILAGSVSPFGGGWGEDERLASQQLPPPNPLQRGRQSRSFTAGHGKAKGSYLVNYRYSFVGILTAAGADFGGEEITFQDLSFHLNFPVLKNAELGFFGIGGLSENIFNSPNDENKIEEEKDLFNIDFKSKMGAVGLTFKKPLNKKIKLNTAVVYSGLEHNRIAEKIINVPQPTRWNKDDTEENKFAFFGKIFYKLNARQNWDMGLQASREQSGFDTFFTDNFGSENFGGKITGWLVQPFINAHIYLLPKIKLDAGVHGHYFTETPESIALLPRAILSFFPNKKQQVSIAYGHYAQTQQPQVYIAPKFSNIEIGATKSRQFTAAFQHRSERGLFLKTEIYHQHLSSVPISAREGSAFSILNNIENFRPSQDTLTNTGKGYNYGIDILLERPILKKSFARLGGSLYRSLYTAGDGVERPTRFDGRYLLNATLGREKIKKKKNKTVVRGSSLRYSFYGGFRQTPVDVRLSKDFGYTVFEERRANEKKLKDYSRVDIRFYWKWNKPKRNTTFSIDLQNVFNRKNEAYHYFDQVQQRVRTKKQLGLIPLLSYRVEF